VTDERRLESTVPAPRAPRRESGAGFGDFALQLVLNALAAVAIGVAAALALTP